MVVMCPKCKVRLKVGDEKIGPEGTRFKCPKCSTVLLVKRPVASVRALDKGKVLAAHEDAAVLDKMTAVLTANGYEVISAKDGIEAMVKATKELPFAAVLSVSIPKIYGFEVCKRLKTRPETKDMKILLMASVYDMRRYRREPESLHDADEYIEAHQIEELLVGKIEALKGKSAEKPAEKPAGTSGQPGKTTVEPPVSKERTHEKVIEDEKMPQPSLTGKKPAAPNDGVERARRLARTIIADIYLYSKAKVDDSIRNDTFHKAFAGEMKEGMKLYENRVSAEVRSLGDFFNEAVNNFIEKRKKEIISNS